MNYQEAKKVVELANEAGVKLAVNQTIRYDPAVQTALSHQPLSLLINFQIRENSKPATNER